MSMSRRSRSVLQALLVLEREHYASRSAAEIGEAYAVLYERAPRLMPDSIPEHERTEVAARLLARWYRLGIPTMTATEEAGGEKFLRRALKNEHISMLRSRKRWAYFGSEEEMERVIHGGDDDTEEPVPRTSGALTVAADGERDVSELSDIIERFRSDVLAPYISTKRSGRAESLETFEERMQILMGTATAESLAKAWVAVHRPPPDDAKIQQRKETAGKALQRLMSGLVTWLEAAGVPVSDHRYRLTLFLNNRSRRGRIGRR